MKSFSPLTTSIFEVFSTQHPNLVQLDAFNEYLEIWEAFLRKQSNGSSNQALSSISSKFKGLFIRARAGAAGSSGFTTATLDSITPEGWESFWNEFNTFWQQQSQAYANTAEIANINKLKSALRALFTQLQSSQANVATNAYFLALRNSDCSASTLKNYRSDINQFLRFANKSQLSELMAKPKVAEFLENEQAKGLTESSVRRKRTSISLFAAWAVQNNWLQSVENLDDLPNPDYKPEAAAVTATTVTPSATSKPEVSPATSPAITKSTLTQDQPKSASRSATATLKSGANGLQAIRRALRNTLRASNTILPIFNLGLLVLFLMGLTWFGYRQFTLETPEIAAFPAQLTRPSRVLSFQGRLTDTVQNPITSSTNMQFRLYDALTGGTLLWDSGTCSVTPDQDGIFSSGLGDDCGSEIDSDVFSENQAVYLEVQVAAETLTPRQPIRTVAYAINSETLQGYPPADPAVESSVLVLDEFGDLNIGSTSPTINATTGTFTIEGQALVLQTATGTDGDITLSPDGTGGVIINSDLDVQGSVRLGAAGVNNVLNTSAAAGAPTGPLFWGDEEIITDASIGTFGVSSVTNADGTLTISPTTGNVVASLNLASANTWTGSQTFSADTNFPGSGIWDSSGNVGIGTTTATSKLTFAESASSTGGIAFGSDILLYRSGTTTLVSTGRLNINTTNTEAINVTGNKVINFDSSRIRADLYQASATSGNALQLRMSAAGLRVLNSAGSQANIAITDSGNVGIGTITPTKLLDVAGESRFRGPVSYTFGTSPNYSYQNVLQHQVSAVQNGAMVIELPSGGNTMLNIRLSGYTWVNNEGAWEVTIGGYWYQSGTTWMNTSVDIRGSAPFDRVRLMRDASNNPVIVLGEVGDTWQYPKIKADVEIAGHLNQSTWASGWSADFSTDLSALTAIAEPTIKTYVTSAGDFGVGTVSPSEKLDVNGAIRLGTAGANNVLDTSAAAGASTGPLFWGDEELITSGSLSSFGVSSVTGTTNQITASPTTGDVILSLPTDLRAPGTFNAVTSIATGAGAGTVRIDASGNLTNIGTVQAADGTAGAPTYSFTSDTNTGIYSAAADQLAISTAGTERVRVDASGNVGIGTATPGSYKLNVNGTAYFSGNLDVNSNLTLNTNGIVYGTGISNKSTANNAYLNTAATGLIASRNIADANVAMIIRQNHASSTGDILQLQNSAGNVVNVSQAGNVGIGSTTPSQKLDIAGAIRLGTAGANNVLNTSAAGGAATGPLFWGDEELAYLSDIGTGGVTSVTGTTNQITASPTTGDVILSLPTDLRAPGTFNAITSIATGAGAGTVRIDASGNLTNIANITASGNITFSGLAADTQTTAVMTDGSGNLSTRALGSLAFDNDLAFTDLTDTPANYAASSEFLVRVNTAGTGLEFIDPSTVGGVTSVSGTANQITASPTTGDVVLSLPADLRAPGTFNAVTSIATGAGAGTVRIDSSGNLTNIGTISASGNATIGGTLGVTGAITATNLNAGGLVKANATTGELVLATAGTDYENPLTFTNGLTRTVNSVALGGTLTGATNINTNGNDLTFSGTGNIGIGSTSTSYPLQVHRSSGQSDIAITTDVNVGSANTTQLSFVSDYDGTASFASIGQYNTGDLRFSSAGNLVAPDVTLHTSGNLGIGTTVPSELLDVAGAIRLGAAGANNVLNTSSTGIGNDPTGPIFWGNEELLTSASLSSYGVSSVTGTTNQITATPTTGDVILSLPTDLRAPGTFNATTSIATGAGAGTVRIDASGNLTNIGTISASGNITSTGGVISMQGAGDNYFAGNVGIGTTAPSAALSVGTSSQFRVDTSGILSFGTNPATAGQIRLPNNTTMAWRNAANTANTTIGLSTGDNFVIGLGETAPSNIIFNTNNGTNGERMRITSAGNVGIGTNAPNRKLEIVGGSDGGTTILAQLRSDFITDNTATTLRFANSTSATAESGAAEITAIRTNAGTAGDTDLSFRVTTGTTPVEALRLLANGNVGIGSTVPSSKLDVDGAIRLGAAGAYNTFNTTSTGVGNDPTGPVFWGNQEILTDATFSSFGVSSVTGTTNEIIANPTVGAVVLSLPTDMRAPGTFNAVTSLATGAGAGTVRIDASGNLTNIGTISSTYLVTSTNVVNLAGANTALQMNGVETITSGRLAQMANGSSAGPAYSFSSDPDTGMSRPVADTLTFATAATERVRINSSGNVGIGTTTPGTYRLNVDGTGYYSGNLDVSTNLTLNTNGIVYGTGIANKSSVNNAYLNTNAAGLVASRNIGDANPAMIIRQNHASSTGDILQLENDTGSVLNVSQDGLVGIGTTTPTYPLQVHRTAGQSDFAITTDANLGSANVTQLSFVSDFDGTPSFASIGQFNTGDLRFSSVGNLVTPDVTLHTSGNLGIGTTNPSELLDVAGAVRLGAAGANNVLNTSAAAGAPTGRLFWGDEELAYYSDISAGGVNSVTGTANQITAAPTTGDVILTLPTDLRAPGTFNATTSIATGAGAGTVRIDASGNLLNIGDITSTYLATSTDVVNLVGASTAFQMNGVETITSGRLIRLADGSEATPAYSFTSSPSTGMFTPAADELAFSTDGTEKVRVDASGNVGIGTTTPTARLDIAGSSSTISNSAGDITIDAASGTISFAGDLITNFLAALGTNGSAAAPTFSFNSDPTSGMFYPGTNGLAFSNNGVERMRFIANGNLGIGTTDPLARFTVEGATVGKALAVFNETGNQDIITASASGATRFRIDRDGYTHSQRFADLANGSYYLDPAATGTSLTTAGNVGIGLTSPLARLHIQESSSSAPRGVIIENIFEGAQGPQIYFRKARGTIGSATTTLNSDTLGVLRFEGYDGSVYKEGVQIVASASEDWTGSAQGSRLRFFTTNIGTTSNTEKMVISSEGNLLVGTTTETAKFVVNQTTTDDIINAYDNGNLRFEVQANGYTNAQRFADIANSSFYLDPAATGDYSLFIAGNIGLNGGGSIKSTGNNNININAGTGTVTIGGGTGKLDAGTIDPPYWINGKGYATYMASMVGVKEEITEVVQLQPSGTPGLYTHEINFDELPEGSDMWLFSRISDIDQEMNNLVVLLSGSSNAYTSYVKDVVNRKLIFYGTRPVEISYRLTAPRFDHEKWPTLRNNQDGRGFKPGEYIFGNSGNGQAVTEADLLADLFEQEPISLNTVGTIEITQDASAGFQLKRNGVLLELAGAFTQAAIAELRSGLITTQELIAERFVSTPELRTDRIAALNDNTVQIQLNDEEGSELQVIDENLQPVARIDRQGNATFTGRVTAESSLLGELIANEASISGELTAGSIDASSARISQLEARMAEVEDIKAITAEFVTATVSGTLFADNINDFDNRVNTALEESSLLNTLLSQVNNSSNTNDTQDVYSSVAMAGYEVTSSNEYDIAFEDLGLADDAFVISPTALFVDEYLRVNNNAFIAGSLGVANQIVVGDGLAIRSGAIEYYSETSNLLEIQPLGGSISLVAGLMTIDENGLVQINGDLFIAGNLTVEGSLLADKLQPADFENPFQIKLATQSATLDEEGNEIDPEFLATQSGEVAGIATESAVTKSRFEIVDELGVPVATISAEGRASFRNGISIDPDETATQSGNIVYSNSTAGVATIPTGSSEVQIFSDKITENSLIYVTPLGATNNQVIYVKGKVGQDPDSEIINGMVRVGFQTLSISDVEFNWWIVN